MKIYLIFIVLNTPKCPLTEYMSKHSNRVGTMVFGTTICGLQQALAWQYKIPLEREYFETFLPFSSLAMTSANPSSWRCSSIKFWNANGNVVKREALLSDSLCTQTFWKMYLLHHSDHFSLFRLWFLMKKSCKLVNIKHVFWFSLQLLSGTFFILTHSLP